MISSTVDAIVVGAGPNGLAAAIELARAGWSVHVVEARDTVGGGARTAELTLPGFQHDVCSAIHPLAAASPFFRRLPLHRYGLRWVQPPIPLAHPFDDGSAAVLSRSVTETAASLAPDDHAYRVLMEPLARDADAIFSDILGPIRLPRHPLALARFGLPALRSAGGFARSRFRGERARALFAGLAAHAMLALDEPASAAFGLVLGLAGHAAGWPFPAGGAQRISDALAAHLAQLGGTIATGHEVASFADLPPSRIVLLDLTARRARRVAGDRLAPSYLRRLDRFRAGPGVFKLDWALSGPIPWIADACHSAGTIHLGGTIDEIAASEQRVANGRHADRPFVILAQPSRFDPTRAPSGYQTAWAYCHVPNGSTVDMAARIEGQVERFAPGFRELILARSVTSPAQLQVYNPNYLGGDINGGRQDMRQLFTRPVPRINPYLTSDPAIFLCSASTPPGGGVHGMCGYFAARTALRRGVGPSPTLSSSTVW